MRTLFLLILTALVIGSVGAQEMVVRDKWVDRRELTKDTLYVSIEPFHNSAKRIVFGKTGTFVFGGEVNDFFVRERIPQHWSQTGFMMDIEDEQMNYFPANSEASALAWINAHGISTNEYVIGKYLKVVTVSRERKEGEK